MNDPLSQLLQGMGSNAANQANQQYVHTLGQVNAYLAQVEQINYGLANAYTPPPDPLEGKDVAGFILAYAFGHDELVKALGFRAPTPLECVRYATPVKPRKPVGKPVNWGDVAQNVCAIMGLGLFAIVLVMLGCLAWQMIHWDMVH